MPVWGKRKKIVSLKSKIDSYPCSACLPFCTLLLDMLIDIYAFPYYLLIDLVVVCLHQFMYATTITLVKILHVHIYFIKLLHI